VDVNGDKQASAIDALQVINEMTRRNPALATIGDGGQSERVAESPSPWEVDDFYRELANDEDEENPFELGMPSNQNSLKRSPY
jgi:hypothetical protein